MPRNGHQLFDHRVRHALFPRSSRMRSDAIIALNSETNGTIDQLLRRSVERARRHFLLSIWALRHLKMAKLTESFAQSQPRCVGLPTAQYPPPGIGKGAFWPGILGN